MQFKRLDWMIISKDVTFAVASERNTKYCFGAFFFLVVWCSFCVAIPCKLMALDQLSSPTLDLFFSVRPQHQQRACAVLHTLTWASRKHNKNWACTPRPHVWCTFCAKPHGKTVASYTLPGDFATAIVTGCFRSIRLFNAWKEGVFHLLEHTC